MRDQRRYVWNSYCFLAVLALFTVMGLKVPYCEELNKTIETLTIWFVQKITWWNHFLAMHRVEVHFGFIMLIFEPFKSNLLTNPSLLFCPTMAKNHSCRTLSSSNAYALWVSQLILCFVVLLLNCVAFPPLLVDIFFDIDANETNPFLHYRHGIYPEQWRPGPKANN